MKRRTFFILAGISTGLLILPPALYISAPPLRKFAVQIIQKELHYLKLEPSGVEKYVDDYFNSSVNDMLVNLRWKTFYYLKISPNQSAQVFELIKYYLLSSDFFIHKTNESRTINYLGLYNPYKSPIPNPYSFQIYPPESPSA